MLQIQFLDYNIADALVPAVSLEPQHVIFIYDSRKISKKYTVNIEKALRDNLPDVSVGFVDADMYSVSDILTKIFVAIEDFKDEKICIDITGGPEIMTAAGATLSFQRGYQMIYTNLVKGKIIDVIKEEQIADVKNITLRDYLTVIGAKRYRDSHPIPNVRDYEQICNVAEYLFKNEDEWHGLQSYIIKKCASNSDMSFDISDRPQDFSGRILDVFENNGFIEKEGSGTYRFTSRDNRTLMMNYGVWLEMYIYIKGKNYFDEIYLGLTIDWDNEDPEDTRDNEIDVVAVRKSVPVFISCKMRKPEAKDIYEVACLADRLGGPQAEALLATTHNVSRGREKVNGLYQRFRRMNVGFIETDSFITHNTADIFNTAMQMSE